MKEEINLLYSLEVPQSWSEEMNIKINISDFSDDVQIIKTLSAIVPFFIKIGYPPEEILDGFNNLVSRLGDMNYLSEADSLAKLYTDDDRDPNLTLEQFTVDLKDNESFVKYMYKMYLDDLEF